MENNYCVYMHTFPNGMQYVGITEYGDCPNKRWANGFGYSSNKEMFSAIVKFGWDNIKHEILHTNLPKNEALRIEEQLIAEKGLTQYGYNRDKGNGCMILCVETQELFASKSEAQRAAGVKSNCSFWKALNNPNRTSGGKHWRII
jgi:hypothetical protein